MSQGLQWWYGAKDPETEEPSVSLSGRTLAAFRAHARLVDPYLAEPRRPAAFRME